MLAGAAFVPSSRFPSMMRVTFYRIRPDFLVSADGKTHLPSDGGQFLEGKAAVGRVPNGKPFLLAMQHMVSDY